jgi:hypothetical protein
MSDLKLFRIGTGTVDELPATLYRHLPGGRGGVSIAPA